MWMTDRSRVVIAALFAIACVVPTIAGTVIRGFVAFYAFGTKNPDAGKYFSLMLLADVLHGV